MLRAFSHALFLRLLGKTPVVPGTMLVVYIVALAAYGYPGECRVDTLVSCERSDPTAHTDARVGVLTNWI
jgi:hypothetical protein